MNHADILITNGKVVTLDANDTRISPGAVAVKADHIAAIGPVKDLETWQADTIIDARQGLILPGLINTHTHSAMALFRGMADDLPLMTWLEDHIFPAETKLNTGMVKTGARLACAEMIRSGITCFCDMYLFTDAVAQATREFGMRAVVGEVLFDFPSPNYGPIEKGFEYTDSLVRKWAHDPLISIAIEPHSPYLCSPELLQTARKIATDNGINLVTHLSETQNEVKQIQEKYGCTPVEHLAKLGILGPDVIACHAVVLTENDIALLKKYDVKVSHNPQSNMKLASGIAPVPELLEAGICVGLGTDGCASNNNLDLFEEMDTAAKLHKVDKLDPTVTSAREVLNMATIDAARVLGMDSKIGSLEPGKLADLIVIDTAKPHLTPMYDPVSHLVYAVRGSDVSHVIINGRLVLENGDFTDIDFKNVADEVHIAVEKILMSQEHIKN
ncbi:MAG: amidohydrolase [Desulfobacteraceae bacterium]|nr:amidohydrolase [Desulfobacteraceae bacterium]